MRKWDSEAFRDHRAGKQQLGSNLGLNDSKSKSYCPSLLAISLVLKLPRNQAHGLKGSHSHAENAPLR